MFDASQEVDIRIPTAEGTKHVKVRFPTDEEIERRQRLRKVFIKDLGRGQSETSIPSDESDLQLFQAIRLEGDDLDAHEASLVIQQLTMAEAFDAQREGNAFRVSLRVPGTETEHLLKIPTQRQIMEFRRNSTRVINLPFGRKEIRINFGPARELYDSLNQERTGYADGSTIPLAHKVSAVQAAIQALEYELAAESEDPANFK